MQRGKAPFVQRRVLWIVSDLLSGAQQPRTVFRSFRLFFAPCVPWPSSLRQPPYGCPCPWNVQNKSVVTWLPFGISKWSRKRCFSFFTTMRMSPVLSPSLHFLLLLMLFMAGFVFCVIEERGKSLIFTLLISRNTILMWNKDRLSVF